MKTKTLTRATFMAKLLTPLPSADLQCEAFTADLLRNWRQGMEDVEYAEHGHFHEAIGLRLRIVGHTEIVSRQYFRNYCEAIAEQCLLAAPTAKEMRWKKRKSHLTGHRADVVAAIARDEARLVSTGEA